MAINIHSSLTVVKILACMTWKVRLNIFSRIYTVYIYCNSTVFFLPWGEPLPYKLFLPWKILFYDIATISLTWMAAFGYFVTFCNCRCRHTCTHTRLNVVEPNELSFKIRSFNPNNNNGTRFLKSSSFEIIFWMFLNSRKMMIQNSENCRASSLTGPRQKWKKGRGANQRC